LPTNPILYYFHLAIFCPALISEIFSFSSPLNGFQNFRGVLIAKAAVLPLDLPAQAGDPRILSGTSASYCPTTAGL